MQMLLVPLYGFFLFLLTLGYAPSMLWHMLTSGKYKESVPQRFFWNLPHLEGQSGKVIWVHAVSVGETIAIGPLAKRLLDENPDATLVVSSVSETGHEQAQRSLPFAHHHVYLPFDFAWNVRAALKRIHPDIVVVCESDCWFNFLRLAKARGARLFLVNGKVSEGSARWYRLFKWIPQMLYGAFDHICVQSEEYLARFLDFGMRASNMTVTGNLKFDAQPKILTEREKQALRNWLGLSVSHDVVVAGSTHAPEEEICIKQMRKVWENRPQAKLLLVPRHPERFDEVAKLLTKENVQFSRYSDEEIDSNARVILVDAMGVLNQLYQIADVAFVAGSFTPRVGGHNILEPLWYGVPTLFGNHMEGQPEMLRLVLEHHAGVQLSPETLGSTILQLLEDPQLVTELREGSETLLHSVQGSVSRTLEWMGKSEENLTD